MDELPSNLETLNLELRVKWLEYELARIAAKVDATTSVPGHDTPTPKPANGN